MRSTYDDINNAFRASDFEHEYHNMITARTMDYLKVCLDTLIFDTTPIWIEVGAPIEKKDPNIAAWYLFEFFRTSIISSQNKSILRYPKAACLGSIIARKRLILGLI